MTKNDKFEADLNRLIRFGEELSTALLHEFNKKQMKSRSRQQSSDNDTKAIEPNLPDFKQEYQLWYSETLALLKQVLPDRVDDFRSHYEYPRVRKAIHFENYVVRDYLQGLIMQNYQGQVIVDGRAAVPEFEQQLAILKSAKSTFTSSLFDIRTILQADLFDTEIDSAQAFLKAGFLRPAGAICGVVIEKHLKQVCENHKLSIRKKHPTISDFNDTLKSGNVIEVSQWRFIQYLADIRNICSHNKEEEPKKEQVEELITSTKKVLKTIF